MNERIQKEFFREYLDSHIFPEIKVDTNTKTSASQ
jgi:hypothetical protein